jgi:hypothetical protein
MARKIDNLTQVSPTGMTVEPQQSQGPISVANNNPNNIDDELSNLPPHEITKDQAKQFIQSIYDRRTTFNHPDFRKSICGALKNLGSDLYSSPVHFLHELIQVILLFLKIRQILCL